MKCKTQSTSHPPRTRAEEFLIADRATFLRALDFKKPSLQPVREALDAGEVHEAGLLFVNHFRRRDISSPLMTDWEALPRDDAFRHPVAEDCLRGRLHDGYNVYDVPEDGIDWVNAPLFCLPRFPVFQPLTEAWHHTRDSRYLRFIVEHTLDYMRAYPIAWFADKHSNEGYRNHYLVGPPTWWCLLPNRLEAWARALTAIRTSSLVTDDEILSSLQRMLQEIRFLMTQVPYWLELQHNVAGFMIQVISILCRVFDDFDEASRWKADNARWLAQYVRQAFYPDGLYKELTLGYSSSVVQEVSMVAGELYYEAGLTGQRERLEAMLTALIGLVRPDGFIPSFGDANGMPIAAVLHKPLVRRLGTPWMKALMDVDAVANKATDRHNPCRHPPAWMTASSAESPHPPFTRWPVAEQAAWGGYYAMRSDWSPNALYMMIDGGPWGATHQHMDKLSFVLSAYGANFITDPGNTLYANNEPDARLSTLHAGFLHNTITVNGFDECMPDEAGKITPEPLDNTWEELDGDLLFVGRYSFAHHADVHWERRVLFVDRSYWMVQDVLTGTATEVEVEQNFQFEPNIKVSLDGMTARAQAPNGAHLELAPLQSPLRPVVFMGEERPRRTCSTQYSLCRGDVEFGHGRGWISRVTNKIVPAPAVTYSGRARLPCIITLMLAPTAPGKENALPHVFMETRGDVTTWHLPKNGGVARWETSAEGCRYA